MRGPAGAPSHFIPPFAPSPGYPLAVVRSDGPAKLPAPIPGPCAVPALRSAAASWPCPRVLPRQAWGKPSATSALAEPSPIRLQPIAARGHHSTVALPPPQPVPNARARPNHGVRENIPRAASRIAGPSLGPSPNPHPAIMLAGPCGPPPAIGCERCFFPAARLPPLCPRT